MSDVVEDEVLEEEEAIEEEDQEEETDAVQEEEESDDGDEPIITFGDEPPKAEGEDEEDRPAPAWVKKVRSTNRKLEKENRKLRRELEQRSTAKEPEIEVGEKPTLKSVKYDEKKYEQELAAWYERKKKADEIEAQKAKAEEEQQKAWQEKQKRYAEQKAAHGFKDYDDAEELVSATLDVTQQGIIVHAAKDAALLTYALGTRPDKLEALAKIKDPVEFAVAIGELQKDLKVSKKKAPAPEKRVKGGTGSVKTLDDQIAKAREKAEKTGDYTEVRKLKAKKREIDNG